MCAIAGQIGEVEGRLTVQRMLESMRHRGPDYSEAMEVSQGVVLGHNRLSIIDLNPSANQPFKTLDGRYTIVFNGEIYNYKELRQDLSREFRFRTESDTEVLLYSFCKWGKDCLEKLIGMFAFAVWDNQSRTLFAARDRFGVKPFYFSNGANTFLFSSEIKALWEAGLPRQRNQKVWASFFVYGSYGMPMETFWSGVNELPAGYYLVRSDETTEVSRWYDFEEHVRALQAQWTNAAESDLMEAYLALLLDSLKLRFRADVPVGFNVSGGLDSSLLLSLIHRLFGNSREIRAYTFYTGDPSYDELPWVKALMDTTTYTLNAVRLKAEDVPSLAEHQARIQDEPFGGVPTLAYANLFRIARQDGTIVLLDGQGIDEAWAGYDYYRSKSDSVVQGVNGSPVRPHVLTEEFRRMAEPPRYPEPFEDRLLNLQYRDIFYTKLPRALRFNDRASMTYSTELREPFLDHRLVEMAFALPIQYKIKDGVGKSLLRRLSGQLLPEAIRLAPKRPLQTPQREWLSGELADWVNDKIELFAKTDGIDRDALQEEWMKFRMSGSDNSFYIWQYISFALL